MGSKFFEELSRCLGKEQIESLSKEDRRLEIFLHGQPVLSVSPGNEVFMLPSGSKNPEANELYHRVAIAADRVFEYVEAMENTPLLRARGLDNKFHLLADFGGAVLAGRERGTGRGYEFVTWIWDYERVGVSHGHYYEDDFAGAKRDFAVRSGLIPKASLFSNEELTEIYRATDHLLAEDPNLNDKQIRAIQEARIKIEFSVPDLDTQLEHRQDYMDGVEVLRSNYYIYFENVWTKFHHLRSTTLKDCDSAKEAIDQAHAFALEQGTFDQKVFYEAFGIFDNQSIEKSLVSQNPLVRIFALLDRRLGKRHLLALEKSMEQELDWVRAFYVIRMQAEGLMEKE